MIWYSLAPSQFSTVPSSLSSLSNIFLKMRIVGNPRTCAPIPIKVSTTLYGRGSRIHALNCPCPVCPSPPKVPVLTETLISSHALLKCLAIIMASWQEEATFYTRLASETGRPRDTVHPMRAVMKGLYRGESAYSILAG